jgi:hypothetical protein
METRDSSLPKQKESHMRSTDCNPSLKFLLPYMSAMMENAAKISYTNFRVTFLLAKMSLEPWIFVIKGFILISFRCSSMLSLSVS